MPCVVSCVTRESAFPRKRERERESEREKPGWQCGIFKCEPKIFQFLQR